MNVADYLGLAYDINNKFGINCWTLHALVREREQHKSTKFYEPISEGAKGIADAFTAAIAAGEHGLKPIPDPVDYCLVLMRNGKKFHCGTWYNGKVLHAKGENQRGGVWYESLSAFDEWDLEFYIDA